MDRPIVKIYISVVFGVLSYILYKYFGVPVTIIAIGVFIAIVVKGNGRNVFAFIMVGFFLLGLLDIYEYYNVNDNVSNIECRIGENRSTYSIGSDGFRKYKILGGDNLEVGQRYVIGGRLEKDPDYSKGVVGSFNVIKSKELSPDIISKGERFKESFYKSLLESGLDEEDAAIVLSLAAGDTRYVTYDMRGEFSKLGISHIISVSGLHLSMIFLIANIVLGIVPAMIISVAYAVFTGGRTATVRALIMMVILILGPKLKKKYDALSALGGAALIILLLRPYSILDVGYMLSFLAVLGIIKYYKKVRRKLYKMPSFVGDSISLTISAGVFTLPYMIFIFRDVSIGGILSNIILVPMYTVIMILGIISMIIFKVKGIFIVIIGALKLIFIASNTTKEFLINITPFPIKYTYLDGVIILFLYLSYTLFKRGKKQLLYIPVAFMILVFFNNYRIFPEISFIRQKDFNIIAVNYMGRDIMISPKKVKLKYVYEDYDHIDRIYDEFYTSIRVELNDMYAVSIIKKSPMIGVIECGENKTLFKDKSSKCDIIVLNKNEVNKDVGHCFKRYEVIGPWIFKTYVY